MKRQQQLIKHDPDNGKYGDCYRTCIACLLGMSADQVPHFVGIAKENPEEIEGALSAQHKYRLAETGAILVDDREQNCTDWEKAGGTAILWPHLGNNSTQTLSDAMVSLRDTLEKQ